MPTSDNYSRNPAFEKYYDLNYNQLKNILKSNPQMIKQLLKDPLIKSKIINSPTKNDFIWLVSDEDVTFLPELLENEGTIILENTDCLLDKLNGLLTSNNQSVARLFDNPSFVKIIIENLSELHYFLYSLSAHSIKKMLEYVQKNKLNEELIYTIITSCKNPEVQLNAIKNFTIPKNILTKILLELSSKSAEYLLNNDFRISTLNNLSYYQLLKIFNKDFSIPDYYLNDKELINKIITILDPKDYRFLINALSKNNDVISIEQKRKKYYEKEIKSYRQDYKMLDRFFQCYQELCTLIDKDMLNWNNVADVLKKYFNFFGSSNNSDFFFIEPIINNGKDKEKLKEGFQRGSNQLLTNMIIDYHFEDIYYNFLLNVKELYNFQRTEGRTLSDQDIELYRKLLTLDDLSYSEKITLFEDLKTTNIIEKYYDDMRAAKNRAYTLMKEQMLNFDNINQHQNKTLTKQYGVPIFVLDGQPFFAFVKATQIPKSSILEPGLIQNLHVDGASYSLDSSTKLNTYSPPSQNYNLIFGDFSINQIVHMYPVDSFSKYDRTSNPGLGTDRIFELHTPTSFTKKSKFYNEIIYSQKNNMRHDELNEHLDVPKAIGIYCYDEIAENDITSAKKLGLGIVLIKTNNYERYSSSDQISMFEGVLLANANKHGIRYLKDVDENPMRGRSK